MLVGGDSGKEKGTYRHALFEKQQSYFQMNSETKETVDFFNLALQHYSVPVVQGKIIRLQGESSIEFSSIVECLLDICKALGSIPTSEYKSHTEWPLWMFTKCRDSDSSQSFGIVLYLRCGLHRESLLPSRDSDSRSRLLLWTCP